LGGGARSDTTRRSSPAPISVSLFFLHDNKSNGRDFAGKKKRGGSRRKEKKKGKRDGNRTRREKRNRDRRERETGREGREGRKEGKRRRTRIEGAFEKGDSPRYRETT